VTRPFPTSPPRPTTNELKYNNICRRHRHRSGTAWLTLRSTLLPHGTDPAAKSGRGATGVARTYWRRCGISPDDAVGYRGRRRTTRRGSSSRVGIVDRSTERASSCEEGRRLGRARGDLWIEDRSKPRLSRANPPWPHAQRVAPAPRSRSDREHDTASSSVGPATSNSRMPRGAPRGELVALGSARRQGEAVVRRPTEYTRTAGTVRVGLRGAVGVARRGACHVVAPRGAAARYNRPEPYIPTSHLPPELRDAGSR